MTPTYWNQAIAELSAADATMAGIIAAYPGELMQSRGDAFYTLARSIVGQQISVKAADAVWGRFESSVKTVNTAAILAKTEEELRECGLSRQKITYLRNIAVHFEENNVKTGFFDGFSDEGAITFLTEIKGVGRWTAEMFLMFHLVRPDVLPIDDIGLQKGIAKHYPLRQIEKRPKLIEMTEIAEQWRPWRTVATWYLWRALDPVPVAY